jgi:PAS domain S-box-containing protein
MQIEAGLNPGLRADPSSPPRAVVVNDSVTQLHLLAKLLQRAGFDPQPFASAEKALASMPQGAPPALIVTDLYMPGIDGWRFCRLLRSPEYASLNHVPLLVVSATFSGEEPSRLAADLGADAFLAAPLDGSQFIQTVQALLNGEKMARSLRVLVAAGQGTCDTLVPAFQAHGYQVQAALSHREALAVLEKTSCDVAVLDYRLPRCSPGGEELLVSSPPLEDELLKDVKRLSPGCVCFMIADDPPPGLALAWMKSGAAAYLQVPFDPEYLIAQCARARRERALLHIPDLLEQRTLQLQESEERLSQVMAATNNGLWDWEIPAEKVYYSPAYFAMLGYAPGELPATMQTWVDLLHPDDRQPALDARQACLDGVIPLFNLEFRLQARDGSWIWVHGRGRVVRRDTDGTPLRMVGTHVDITDRKRAEIGALAREAISHLFQQPGTLEATCQKLTETLVSTLGFPIAAIEFYHPAEGVMTFAGTAGMPGLQEGTRIPIVQTLSGVVAASGEELLEIHASQRIEYHYAALRSLEVETFLCVPILILGEAAGTLSLADRRSRSDAAAWLSDMRTIASALGLEIQRKWAEDALRKQEHDFSTLIMNASDIIARYDTDLRLVYCNPAAERMLGVALSSLQGKTPLENAQLVQGAQYRDFVLRQVLEMGIELDAEQELPTTGGMRTYHTRITPERSPEGRIESLLTVSRDITRLKQVEVELRQSEERYRGLFEASPVSLWEEDFSAVFKYLDQLKEQGIEDVPRYLELNPQVVKECASMVQVLDVNRATLQLYGARDKAELLSNLSAVFCDDSYTFFRQELVQVLQHPDDFLYTFFATNQTLEGRRMDIQLVWSLLHRQPASKVIFIISIIDVTASKQAEARITEQLEELRRWQAIILGREERILELKSEINRLLAEAGKPPRYSSVMGDLR